MIHNPNDIEDVLKTDSNDGDTAKGDDGYDSLGHGVCSRPIASLPVKKRVQDGYRDRTRVDRLTGWTA